MKEAAEWFAILLVFFGLLIALLAIVRMGVQQDDSHYRRAAEAVKHACGRDFQVDVKAHNEGWWYEVKCRRSNGEIYLIVVR